MQKAAKQGLGKRQKPSKTEGAAPEVGEPALGLRRESALAERVLGLLLAVDPNDAIEVTGDTLRGMRKPEEIAQVLGVSRGLGIQDWMVVAIGQIASEGVLKAMGITPEQAGVLRRNKGFELLLDEFGWYSNDRLDLDGIKDFRLVGVQEIVELQAKGVERLSAPDLVKLLRMDFQGEGLDMPLLTKCSTLNLSRSRRISLPSLADVNGLVAIQTEDLHLDRLETCGRIDLHRSRGAMFGALVSAGEVEVSDTTGARFPNLERCDLLRPEGSVDLHLPKLRRVHAILCKKACKGMVIPAGIAKLHEVNPTWIQHGHTISDVQGNAVEGVRPKGDT